MITKNVKLYLGDGFPVRVPVSQFDTMWQFVFTIIHNSQPWQIPTGATAVLNGKKPDGNVFAFSGTIENNTVTVDADVQMTAVAGVTTCELSILSDGKVVGTANFIMDVEAAPKAPEDVSSETTLPAYQEMLDAMAKIPYDIHESVESWLDAHPEATTTVQDGSITEQKLSSELADKINSGTGSITYPDADCVVAFIEAMQEKADKYGLDMTVNGPAGFSDDATDNQLANGKAMAKLYAMASGYAELCKIWNTSADKTIYSKGTITTAHLLHSSVYGYNDGGHYANSLTDYYDMLGGKTGTWSPLRLLGAIIKGPDDILLCGWVRRSGNESSSSNRWSCMKKLVDIAYALIANPSADISSMQTALVNDGCVAAEIIKLPMGNMLLYEKANLTDSSASAKYDTFIYGYNDTTKDKIASNTKVLTAITALDYVSDLNEIVTLTASDVANQNGGTDANPKLSAGEKFTVKELLYAMMMPSSNRAAQAVARHVGNKLLNQKYNGITPSQVWRLTSIAVTTMPTKTSYDVGDTLNTGGMVVTATYTEASTGATKSEIVNGYTCSPTTFSTGGAKVITVSYTENSITKTTTFSVNVSEPRTLSSIAADYSQSGVVYDVDPLRKLKQDLVVTAHYTDSTTAVIPDNEYSLSGTLAEGTSIITVTYSGKTTTFNTTVTRAQFQTGYVTVGNPVIDNRYRLTGDSNNFIKTPFNFNNNGKPWELRGKFRASARTQPVGANKYYDIVTMVDSNNTPTRGMLVEMNGSTGYEYLFNLFASSTGASWDIVNPGQTSFTIQDMYEGDIYFKTGWTGSTYYIAASADGVTWDSAHRAEWANKTTSIMTGNAIAFGPKRGSNISWGYCIYVNSLELDIDGALYWKAVAGDASDLPDEYQEVDYIESDESQYIDTGYVPNLDTEIETAFKLGYLEQRPSVSVTPYGLRNASTNNWIGLYQDTNTNHTYTSFGSNHDVLLRKYGFSDPYVNLSDSFFTMTHNKDGVSVDHIKVVEYSDTAFPTETLPIYLFGRNDSGVANRLCKTKMQNFIIRENGNNVAYFIPCYRKADGVVGMYETVGKQFYTNAGTGTFGKGKDVNY